MIDLQISKETKYFIDLFRFPVSFSGSLSDFERALGERPPNRHSRTFLNSCVQEGILISTMWKFPWQNITVSDTYKINRDKLESVLVDLEIFETLFDIMIQRLGIWQSFKLFSRMIWR